MRVLALAVLIPAFALAQQPSQVPPQPAATGTVTGRVLASDTNLPARLATVTLQPIRELPPETQAEKDGETNASERRMGPPVMSLHPIQTRLDGTFTIPRVAIGFYYVIVQHPGYLSPVAQFTKQEIDRPTPDIRERIAKLIPTVAVTANQTATLDLRLHRAASVSGTIRYDDGTPAPAQGVSFARHDKAGKWVTVNMQGFSQTDDLGHFRISGLPPDTYRLSTSLNLTNSAVDSVFGGSHSMSTSGFYSINLFLGDTFVEAEAKTLKLDEGEDRSGVDFTFPLAKLHAISGTLVAAGSGRVINAGTVRLAVLSPDSASATTQDYSAKVDPEDRTFRFEFVPEGNYTIRVVDARDVTRETPPPLPGRFADPFDVKETTVRTYGTYEAPFKVETDLSGLNLPMPPASKAR